MLFRTIERPRNSPPMDGNTVPKFEAFRAVPITTLVHEGILPANTLADSTAVPAGGAGVYPRRNEVREGRRARGRGRGRRADDEDLEGSRHEEEDANSGGAAYGPSSQPTKEPVDPNGSE